MHKGDPRKVEKGKKGVFGTSIGKWFLSENNVYDVLQDYPTRPMTMDP